MSGIDTEPDRLLGGSTPGDERWAKTWENIIGMFEDDMGTPPPATNLDEDDLIALSRFFSLAIAPGHVGPSRSSGIAAARRSLMRLADSPSGASLADCKQQLRKAAELAWTKEAAETEFTVATNFETAGDLAGARAAYERCLDLGHPKPLGTSSRFAQLLLVLGSAEGGGIIPCEALLRRALGLARDASPGKEKMTPARRELLARLVLLLIQEGRETEAEPLLRSGAWQYRLASWVLRHSPRKAECLTSEDRIVDGSPKLLVFDDALPSAVHTHLSDILAPCSVFWREHGYNQVQGSTSVGYFSYVHDITPAPSTSMDVVIRQMFELLQPHFPEIARATRAEWWAHCRPHSCGHQLHYDSDNEGIGGARHPILSLVFFVHATEGVGGPTLITNQRLGDLKMATHGWLVYPKAGRVIAYEGTVLHGVVPGHGDMPDVATCRARRVTFMMAFWDRISHRAFSDDGLPGSSRPIPDPKTPFTVGPMHYTWHQALDLQAVGLDKDGLAAAVPKLVAIPACPNVWIPVDPNFGGDASLPQYDACFQF